MKDTVATMIDCPYCGNGIRVGVKYQDLSKPIIEGCYVDWLHDKACGKSFLIIPIPRIDCAIYKIEEVVAKDD